MRKEAIKWWKGLEGDDKMSVVSIWREITIDFRRDWPFYMINVSDSAIEKIYREVILEENFN